MPNRQQVEQRRRDCEAREPDEHHSDHDVPNKGHVTPERCHHILAVDHRLTLRGELAAGQLTVAAKESSGS